MFHNANYANLLKLLITSISVNARFNKQTTDILILTSPTFQPLIQRDLENFDLPIYYYLIDLHTLFDAGCARLDIFEYENIGEYDKILYLDTDILINSNVNILFELDLSLEKIYTLEEGTIGHEYWGKQFFDLSKKEYNIDKSAFTSGILLFRNSPSMKTLFHCIKSHILEYIFTQKNSIPICLDQPFIVYNAISQNKYDNQLLKSYVENNPSNVNSKKIVYHFPGGPGAYSSKFLKMTAFWEKMNNKIKICHYGNDGFGHQLEGMMRLISLALNNKAEYVYDLRKQFVFEHTNFDTHQLNLYLLKALEILSYQSKQPTIQKEYKITHNETRTFEEIMKLDEYSNTVYCYDGVGCGKYLPSNFEDINELMKSLPKLRQAFVLENQFLPKPSYDNNCINVVCHIRLGDAVGTRILDNEKIIHFIKTLQSNAKNHVTVHSDGNIDFLKTENTTLCDRNTDVLQILSDFIYADMLVINYSSLSISAHLLADDKQKVFCPSNAGPTFYKRILSKCERVA